MTKKKKHSVTFLLLTLLAVFSFLPLSSIVAQADSELIDFSEKQHRIVSSTEKDDKKSYEEQETTQYDLAAPIINEPVKIFLQASVFIAFFLFCFLFVVWLLLKFDDQYRARLSALSQRRGAVFVFALFFIIAVSGFGFYSLQVLKEKQQRVTATFLNSILNSTQLAISSYFEKEKERCIQIAKFASQFTPQSQKKSSESTTKIWSEIFSQNHTLVIPSETLILSQDYIILYSKLSSMIGGKSEIAQLAEQQMTRAFLGETIVFPYLTEVSSLSGNNHSSLTVEPGKTRFFVASPVYNDKSKVEAVVVMPSVSGEDLSYICQSSRIGENGEVFLVDRNGLIVTASHVSESSVSPEDQQSASETQPSPAAYTLVKTEAKRTPTVYINYLGKEVVGIWQWDEAFDLGYVFEISSEEFDSYLQGSRQIVIAAILTCSVIAGAVFFLVFLHGEYRSRVLRKSHERLEDLADERLQKLKKNDELYSLVVNSTNDGIWEWQVDSGHLTFSDRYLEILNYSREEFADNIDTWMSFVHNDDRAIVREKLAECLEGKVAKFSVIFRMLHKLGYWVWLQGTGIHVKDDNGKVFRLAGTHADVTARKIAEVELEQRERKFSAVFNQSVNFTCILDAHGRILELNDYAQKVTDQRIEDVAGILIWECPWAKASSGLAEYFKEIIHKVLQGTQISFEREIIVFSNRNFIFNMTVSPIRDEKGLVQLILLSGHDVTQTRNVEKYLRNSEQRFREMFQNFPVVYYSIDDNGVIKDCNDMFTEVLGYGRSETLGRRISEFYADADKGFFESRIDALLQKGLFEGESSLVHRDGHVINFILTSRAQYDIEGNFLRSHSMLVDITERKNVEMLQARLNAILENTPAAVCMQDLDGSLLFANDVWANFLGLKVEELTGKKVEDIFQQREAKQLAETFERVLHTGRSEVWESVHIFSAEEHFFQNQSFPIWDSENNLQAIGHISTEITEQRLAESELRKAQAILKSIMDNSSAMVFAKNLDGEYTMMNESFCSFWGVDSVESLGKKDEQLFSEEIAELYRESDEAVISTGGPISLENSIESPVDGSKQTMYLEKFIIYDETGEMNGTGGIATDITPIKEIQNLLKASEERLRFSLASMGTYYWEYNFLTDQLVYDSAEYFSQFGYTENEFPTNMSSYRSFVHPGDVDKVDELFNAHVKRKIELYKTEYRFKAHDGKWFWNLDIGRVVEQTESGDPLKLAGITIDISERKEMEAWLNLERDKAEAAARAKTQFMANMSHEIRTPMNAIIGLCYLLGKTDTDAKQQNYLNKIELSSKALLGIINDILDFSKIEAGKVNLENTDFKFKDIINQLNSYLGHMALAKGLKFTFTIDERIPEVLRGDSHRLQQVLTNLISNAIKFTEKGGVTVHAQYVGSTDNTVDVELEVADTGIGIAKNEINKVFKAFSQADESTTRRFGGTGLGLSITHSLVLMMGGAIKVTSKIGKGSKFTVKLSFNIGEKNLLQSSADTLIPDLRSQKILLAEDNPLNQEVVLGILEDTGCEITTVENGLQALQEMKKGIYDIVLMDVQMSTMDGLEATSKMRAWELAKGKNRLPILAITADVLLEDHQKTRAAGMDGHINKPVSPPEMFAEIMRWTGTVRTVQPPRNLEKRRVSIEGMDMQAALIRLGGREELLLRLLKQFVVDKADVVDQIRAALKSGNRSWAETIVHNLKGIAGTFEADELRKITIRLEKEMQAGETNFEEYLQLLELQLDPFVRSINDFFATQVDEKIKKIKPISVEKFKKDFLELELLLNNGDPKAVNKIEELIERGLNEAIFPKTNELKTFVQRFDFEEALKILKR